MIGIIILSIIQGITEFLPISSSAHLIIAREVFNIGSSITSEMALSFDLAVHLGTLIAIIVYFFSELFLILRKGISTGLKEKEGKIFWFIIIATIPGALAGFIFEDIIENMIRGNLYLIAATLALMGFIIYYVDKISEKSKTIFQLNFKNIVFIGLMQAFALIPGFSRSGTTIAAGRLMKLNREDSAKFAFYLAIPITLGAIMYKGKSTFILVNEYYLIFIVGVVVSFLTGLIVINFLLNYLKRNDLKIFMWYRLLLAIIIILLTI